MEIWKDIKGYEGFYQVSSLGNVKSLDRFVRNRWGAKKLVKGQNMKFTYCKDGYSKVILSDKSNRKTKRAHIMVAESFLGHIPCKDKLVINHIDFNVKNNRVDNLEIVTTRQNTNKKHLSSSSKYTGVGWHKLHKKWQSQIHINKKRKYLGTFENEYDAHLAYEKALTEL